MRPWSSPSLLSAGAHPTRRGYPSVPRPVPPPRRRRASSGRVPPCPRPAEPALEMVGSKCQPGTPTASLYPADSPHQHRAMPPGPASRVNVGSRPHAVTNGHELFEVSEERDEEVAAFCHMLDILRSGSDIQDYSLTGYVWSAVTPSPEHLGDEVNLKVTVLCDSLREPLTFTCNCSSTVDLLIYQTLCYTHDELRDVDVGDFVLKPCGLEEFLQKEGLVHREECLGIWIRWMLTFPFQLPRP